MASAIATEDVDSRDWMTPDDPRVLAERVARLLGGSGAGESVAERLGRDLWLDYLSDTGDDVSVSRAVAGLVFAEYELPDPERPGEHLLAPRGDVLLFGGDTAYPVATADEIRNRVVVPFNQVLTERDDGRRRVLIGIPGNHDWYDGLDGFGRLFRRHVDWSLDGRPRATLHGTRRTLLGHYAEWAREFVRGGHVHKPATLDLAGYVAVQSASYFILPVAPGLGMLAVDRQLKHIDSRQQQFFSSWLNERLAVAPWVVLPDPVYSFGTPSATGAETVQALGLTLTARPHLVLSGDIHHYRRDDQGPTIHVTAGGGGAFLHPAALTPHAPELSPAVAWPAAKQSRVLLMQVPWIVMFGRAGLLPHIAFAVLLVPVALAYGNDQLVAVAALASGSIVAAAFALIGGRRRRLVTFVLAVLAAAVVFGASVVLRTFCEELIESPRALFIAAQVAFGALAGAFVFGAFLALLTRLGIENLQAFAALDHPGFKHFVRFRVRRDGSAVDAWCVGLVDPLRPGASPVLVDAFTWRSR